ncbi:MAG: RagB/SusD family nutrient uptake outer membrane protein [Capnocytophaga sp.]|nr:RagB/SusD family nutrient uptake outer membrane protein [Capnocytophaga sp.]
MKLKHILICFTLGFLATSCEKYLEITPKGEVIPETLDHYSRMLNQAYYNFPDYKDQLYFRDDNVVMNDALDLDVSASGSVLSIYFWEQSDNNYLESPYKYREFYNIIFYANEIIKGVSDIANSSEKQELLAETYALRAYAYFGLINLYAPHYNATTASTDKGVPLVFETDLEAKYPKSSVQAVYNQILSDLNNAENMMITEKREVTSDSGTIDRATNYRFSKVSVYAFLSRVHLYMSNWAKAEEYADKALAINADLYDMSAFTMGSLSSRLLPYRYQSVEMLLALDTPSANMSSYVYVTDEFLDKMDPTQDRKLVNYSSTSTSQITDRRMLLNVMPDYYGTYLNQYNCGWDCLEYYKYTVAKPNIAGCSFRTAELYLNKAEAQTRQNKDTEAKAVLLTLLQNRHATSAHTTLETTINGLSNADLLQRILDERDIEFFAEGHRWFDLRRANQKQIVHTYQTTTYTLQANDPRYTISFPAEAVKQNPLLGE